MTRLAAAFLYLLVFAIPWENSALVAGIGTMTRLIGIVAAVFGFLAIVEHRGMRRLAPIHVVAVAFVLWIYTTILWTYDPHATVQRVETFAQLGVLLVLIWEFAPDADRQKNVMAAFVLGCYVSSADTLLMYLSGQTFSPEAWDQRYAAKGFDPNDLGLTLAIAIPFAWYLATVAKSRLVAWTWRAYVPFAMLAILLTASRGAFLASAVALMFIPLTMSGISFRRRVLISFAAPIAIGLVIAYVPQTSWARLSTTSTQFENRDFASRGEIWAAGWETFKDAPIMGVGAGAFAEAVGSRSGIYRVAHNAFLGVLVETGTIGFLMFMTVAISLSWSIRRFPKLERRCWTIVMMTWALGVSALSWEFQKTTWLLFGLLAAQRAAISVRDTRRVAPFRSVRIAPPPQPQVAMPAARAAR